jgi:acyl-CoA thioesterase FadM
VVGSASCTFLEPPVYPGEIEVRMCPGDLGRTSVGSYCEIWMQGRTDAMTAARG